jgi:hypothetical protein
MKELKEARLELDMARQEVHAHRYSRGVHTSCNDTIVGHHQYLSSHIHLFSLLLLLLLLL